MAKIARTARMLLRLRAENAKLREQVRKLRAELREQQGR